MSYICFVKMENAKKAEDALRKDDVASRQSITVRDAKILGIEKDGSFFLIDGTEQGIEKCKELIKDFAENIDEKILEKAKKKIKEESEKAAEGFGGLFR